MDHGLKKDNFQGWTQKRVIPSKNRRKQLALDKFFERESASAAQRSKKTNLKSKTNGDHSESLWSNIRLSCGIAAVVKDKRKKNIMSWSDDEEAGVEVSPAERNELEVSVRNSNTSVERTRVIDENQVLKRRSFINNEGAETPIVNIDSDSEVSSGTIVPDSEESIEVEERKENSINRKETLRLALQNSNKKIKLIQGENFNFPTNIPLISENFGENRGVTDSDKEDEKLLKFHVNGNLEDDISYFKEVENDQDELKPKKKLKRLSRISEVQNRRKLSPNLDEKPSEISINFGNVCLKNGGRKEFHNLENSSSIMAKTPEFLPQNLGRNKNFEEIENFSSDECPSYFSGSKSRAKRDVSNSPPLHFPTNSTEFGFSATKTGLFERKIKIPNNSHISPVENTPKLKKGKQNSIEIKKEVEDFNIWPRRNLMEEISAEKEERNAGNSIKMENEESGLGVERRGNFSNSFYSEEEEIKTLISERLPNFSFIQDLQNLARLGEIEPIFVDYKNQFSEEAPKQLLGRTPNLRENSRTNLRAKKPQRPKKSKGRKYVNKSSSGKWSFEDGQKVYINKKGKKYYGRIAYLESLKENPKAKGKKIRRKK